MDSEIFFLKEIIDLQVEQARIEMEKAAVKLKRQEEKIRNRKKKLAEIELAICTEQKRIGKQE